MTHRSTVMRPPLWQIELLPECQQLRYRGKKPIPSAIRIDNHFELPFPPGTLVKEGGDSAVYPFVRCFPHPEDFVHRASAAARQRFYEDEKRYPPMAYEDHNPLCRGEEWRPVSSREQPPFTSCLLTF